MIGLAGDDIEGGLSKYRNGPKFSGTAIDYAKKIVEAEKALKALKNPCEQDIMAILRKIYK